jgi:choline monooxygenase
MSDLSLQLQQARSQLPVSSYFDQALFQRELETIFQRGPRYVGHSNAVPNVGDYHALQQEGRAGPWCAHRRAWNWFPTSAATARR